MGENSLVIRSFFLKTMLAVEVAHFRYIKIVTRLPGFLIIFLCLVWFSLCSSLFWELRDNGVVWNFQFRPQMLSHGRIQEARGLLNGNINTGVFSFCNSEEANNIASIEILNRNAPFNDALLTLRVNQSNHLSQRLIFPTSSTACSTVQYIYYLPNMQRGPLLVFDTLACDCISKG